MMSQGHTTSDNVKQDPSSVLLTIQAVFLWTQFGMREECNVGYGQPKAIRKM